MENKELIQRFKKEIPSLYTLEHYTIRGNPITFKISGKNEELARLHRPWQEAILNDNHPDKVVRKSRQLGFSELSVAELMWFNDVHSPVKSMYTFPRARQMVDFVKTRMNPVIDGNKYFKSIIDSQMNSIEVKRIRNSFMLFRSAWGSALGEGIDIDYLALDEFDRMGDGVELAFQESMKSSAFGWLRRWSTPTIPGRGIDLVFNKSDQRFYMHKCEHCNHWQIISIEDNIRQYKKDGVNLYTDEIEDGTFGFVCAKCSKPLDRWYNGAWVAKHPERKGIRGYHISQLNAVWISADQIKRNELKYSSKQLFRNYVVGEPFSAEGLIINEDDILSATRLEQKVYSRQDYKSIIVGIDWGVRNWCAVTGIKEDGQVDLLNLFMFSDSPNKPLEPVSLLATSLKPYNPDIIIADAGFGADRNTYLMQLFPGRVWACQYNTYKGNSKPQDSWNENTKLVSVDKTLKVQRLLHTIKARGIGFWRTDEDMMVLTKHLKNTRIMDMEENGIVYQLATRIGDDHYASCLVYALIGVEKIKNIYAPKSSFNWEFL